MRPSARTRKNESLGYLTDLVEGEAETRQQFENGDESGGGIDGEQPESFLDERGESDETGVVVAELDAHQEGADDIGNGRRQVRAQLNGSSPPLGHVLQQSLHFTLKMKMNVEAIRTDWG